MTDGNKDMKAIKTADGYEMNGVKIEKGGNHWYGYSEKGFIVADGKTKKAVMIQISRLVAN